MDLQSFVSKTLMQIIQGVTDAQSTHTQLSGKGMISPPKAMMPDATSRTSLVEFDIAVVVEDHQKKEGQGEIKVIGIGFGGQKGSETIQSATSRVKFTVPIILPQKDC